MEERLKVIIPGTMITIEGFLAKHPDLARDIITKADNGWVLSGPEGEVYWANEKFCEETGYTLVEFTRTRNPVTWIQISAKDDTLQASVQQAKESVEGKLQGFRMVKTYIAKTGQPKMARINVRRYPPDSDIAFEFFVVEVNFVDDPHLDVARRFEELQRSSIKALHNVNANLERYADAQEKRNEVSLGAMFMRSVDWCVAHPKVSLPLILIPLAIFLGEDAWTRIVGLARIITGRPPIE